MVEILIRLEEHERVLNALNVSTNEEIKAKLMSYLNSRVNDFEQSIEMQKVVETYEFIPLIELEN